MSIWNLVTRNSDEPSSLLVSITCDESFVSVLKQIAVTRGQSVTRLMCELLSLAKAGVSIRAVPSGDRPRVSESGRKRVLRLSVPMDLYEQVVVCASIGYRKFQDVARDLIRLVVQAGPEGRLIITKGDEEAEFKFSRDEHSIEF